MGWVFGPEILNPAVFVYPASLRTLGKH